MFNTITEKFNIPFRSGQKVTQSFPAFKQENSDEKKDFIQTVKDNKMNILAGGLLTGGAVLLYLGLTKPGKYKLFNNFVEEKISDMENIVRKFSDYATDNIVNSFKETVEYISAYRKTHIFKPTEFLHEINMLKDPSKLADAQDLAFSAIYAQKKNLSYVAGDIDEFATKFNKIKYRVTVELERQKHRTEMELDDYRRLPKSKELYTPQKTEAAETRLNTAQNNLIKYMNRVKDARLNTAIKSQYRQMANAIVESCLSVNKSKETILDTTFGKIKRLLHLGEDFVPEYNLARYELPTDSSLASHLKPQTIPDDISKNIDSNLFLKIVEEEDLRGITDKDIKKIFFKTPVEYNLKDLRYLIDRIRLREALVTDGKDKRAYNSVIVKLKYLSNRLNDFGEKQVVEFADFDFTKLNEEQRRAKLYYLSTAGRRFGFESFDLLNAHMLKNSGTYRNLSLKDHAKHINNNPDLYFVG